MPIGVEGHAGIPGDFPQMFVRVCEISCIATPGRVLRGLGNTPTDGSCQCEYLVYLGAATTIMGERDAAKGGRRIMCACIFRQRSFAPQCEDKPVHREEYNFAFDNLCGRPAKTLVKFLRSR